MTTSITIVFSGALGDTVLLKPLIDAVAIQFASRRITLVAQPSFGRLFKHLGWIYRHFDIGLYNHHQWFAGNTAARQTPWSDCDVLISGVSTGHDIWAHHASRLSTARKLLFFDPLPNPADPTHVAIQRCRSIGVPPDIRTYGDPQHCPIAWQPQPEPDMRPLFIHPGSGSRNKCWPLENFAAVAKCLRARGRRAEFILGPVEMERFSARGIDDIARNFTSHIIADLSNLADLLVTGSGYLGNDSGVTHLAGALGVPTGAIFICSNPNLWRPIGPRVKVLRRCGP